MGKIGNLYIMIGAPGSGKSSLAKKLAEKMDGIVYSSDDIREELAHKYGLEGGADNQAVSEEAFNVLYERTFNGLLLGKTIFYDATNISRISREALISSFRENGAEFNAFFEFLDTPLDVCNERNVKRYNIQKTNFDKEISNSEPRLVPEKVIKNMHTYLEKPFFYEGYCDKIIDDENFDINKYVLDIRKKSYKENFSFLVKRNLPNISLVAIQDCFDTIDLALDNNNYINLSLMLKVVGNKRTTEEKLNNYMNSFIYLDETYNQLNKKFFKKLEQFLNSDMTIESLKDIINDDIIWDCIEEVVESEKSVSQFELNEK